MNNIIRHLSIRGRVQGVGFRRFMVRTAQELQVTGWVRNRPDGSLEAVIAGSSEAVHTLIERARHGPQRAVVMALEVTETHGSFKRFDTLPTG